jgi:hypothetical protein
VVAASGLLLYLDTCNFDDIRISLIGAGFPRVDPGERAKDPFGFTPRIRKGARAAKA